MRGLLRFRNVVSEVEQIIGIDRMTLGKSWRKKKITTYDKWMKRGTSQAFRATHRWWDSVFRWVVFCL